MVLGVGASAQGLNLEDVKAACTSLTNKSRKFAELDVAQREMAEAQDSGWTLMPPGVGQGFRDAYEDVMLTVGEQARAPWRGCTERVLCVQGSISVVVEWWGGGALSQ